MTRREHGAGGGRRRPSLRQRQSAPPEAAETGAAFSAPFQGPPPGTVVVDAPPAEPEGGSRGPHNPGQDGLPRMVRRPWDDATEGARGKLELLWEDRLVPVGHWLGAAPIRLFGGWRRTVRLGRGRRARLGLAWNWGDQGVRMLKQLTRVLLMLTVSAAVLVVLGAAAVRIASAVVGVVPSSFGMATPTVSANIPAISIHNAGNGSSVAAMPTYTFGLWPGNDTPAKGSQFTIFARISNQTLPMSGVTVSISFGGHGYSAVTNSDGIASFAVNAGNQAPITVSGTVTIGGQTLSATTSFNPV